MKLIRQTNSKGCGVACAAMVTELSYEDCRRTLFGTVGKVSGMFHDDVVAFIKSKGFNASKRLYSKEDPSVLKPIEGCEAHLLEVRVYSDSEMSHFVVMDNLGNIFDPIFGKTELGFYHDTWSIIGFWKGELCH